MKKSILIVLTFIIIATISLGGCGGGQSGSGSGNEDPSKDTASGGEVKETKVVATVPKMIGVNWFDSMDWRGEEWAKENGAEAHYIGPVDFDSAAQLQSLNDAIALQPDVLTVVPIAADACDELLKQAQGLGTTIVTHEGGTLKNIDYNVDAFENGAFGENFAKKGAEIAGENAVVALTVGQLTVPSHNAWSDAFYAYAKANYPNMTFINKVESDRAIPYESMDDSDESYKLGKELIQANPNLTLIFAGSASSTNGFCRAVRELDKIGKVFVVGIAEASGVQQEFKEGSLSYAAFWYPGDAQYACYEVGKRVREGKEIKTGDDLGSPGYESVIVDGKNIYGKAWLDVTPDNYVEQAKIL